MFLDFLVFFFISLPSTDARPSLFSFSFLPYSLLQSLLLYFFPTLFLSFPFLSFFSLSCLLILFFFSFPFSPCPRHLQCQQHNRWPLSGHFFPISLLYFIYLFIIIISSLLFFLLLPFVHRHRHASISIVALHSHRSHNGKFFILFYFVSFIFIFNVMLFNFYNIHFWIWTCVWCICSIRALLFGVERAKWEQLGMGMLHVFVLLLSCVNILSYLISHPSEYILLILSLFVVDNARTM